MASGLANPIDDPLSWDTIVIGSMRSPGIIAEDGGIEGFERKWNWDKKTGKGAQGTTNTYVGQPAVEGTITFWLWDRSHFQQWEQFRPAFKYDPTKKTLLPIDIYHPSLADLNIAAVYVQSISPIRLVDQRKKIWAVRVTMLEFIPPPPIAAVVTPTGSKASVKPPTLSVPALDPDQQLIANDIAAIKRGQQP